MFATKLSPTRSISDGDAEGLASRRKKSQDLFMNWAHLLYFPSIVFLFLFYYLYSLCYRYINILVATILLAVDSIKANNQTKNDRSSPRIRGPPQPSPVLASCPGLVRRRPWNAPSPNPRDRLFRCPRRNPIWRARLPKLGTREPQPARLRSSLIQSFNQSRGWQQWRRVG